MYAILTCQREADDRIVATHDQPIRGCLVLNAKLLDVRRKAN
jgi:hypothetical protein